MREKAFQKAELTHTSSNIWRMQKEAHKASKLKTSQKDIPKSLSEQPQSKREVETVAKWLKEAVLKAGLIIEEGPALRVQDLEASSSFLERASNAHFELMGYLERIKELVSHQASTIRDLQNQLQESNGHAQCLSRQLSSFKSPSKSGDWEAIRQTHNYELENLMRQNQTYREEAMKYKQELDQTKAQLEEEISSLTYSYTQEIQELSKKLEESTAFLEDSKKSDIENLKLEYRTRENQLRYNLERVTEEDSKKISELQASIRAYSDSEEALRKVLQSINEKLSPIYRTHAASNTEWSEEQHKIRQAVHESYPSNFGHFLETLVQVEFLSFIISKLSSDNHWLVEKLTEYNKLNEELRKKANSNKRTQELSKQMLRDIQATTQAMENYQSARSNLMNQVHYHSPKVEKFYNKYFASNF